MTGPTVPLLPITAARVQELPPAVPILHRQTVEATVLQAAALPLRRTVPPAAAAPPHQVATVVADPPREAAAAAADPPRDAADADNTGRSHCNQSTLINNIES